MNWGVFWTVVGLASCLLGCVLLANPSPFKVKLGCYTYLALVLFLYGLAVFALFMNGLYHYGKL